MRRSCQLYQLAKAIALQSCVPPGERRGFRATALMHDVSCSSVFAAHVFPSSFYRAAAERPKPLEIPCKGQEPGMI